MRFFVSKRLPLGIRAGILFDPLATTYSPRRSAVPNGIRKLGSDVVGVYVITGAHGMSKIGISTDPEARLATLQTGSHAELKLQYVLAVNTIDPRLIEAEAHRILSKNRMVGEWFDVTPEMAKQAIDRAATKFGIQTFHTTSDKLLSLAQAPDNDKMTKVIAVIFLGLGFAFWLWLMNTLYHWF